MPVVSVVVVLAATALLAVGIARLPYWRSRPSSRPLTIIVLAMAVSTGVRVPDVSDSMVDPWLDRLIGVQNGTELVAAVFGIYAFMTAVELVAITGSDRPRTWRRTFTVLTPCVAAVAVVAFLLSPAAGTPSTAIFRDFPLDTALTLFWLLYVGTLIGACLSALFYLIRLVRLPGVWASPLGRPLLLMTAGAVAGLLPAANLLFRLRMYASYTPDWYAANATVIGQAAALLPLSFIGAAALAYSATVLPDRLQRYRAIRRFSGRYADVLQDSDDVMVPRNARTYATRRAAWVGSRSSMITHQMMVVLADAAVRSGETGRPQAAKL